ncbi:MAG TPA: transcription elongation factor GreA [Candidatus Saccharimonadales bacterium]|nr:transcription elongation factor GreA [Candidatus Saccharimonadales bacterium]
MKKDYQLTKEGRTELEKELEALKSRRSEIAEKIKAARDFGDLSENAEYDAARDEQAQVESRISEIEEILQNSSLIVGTNGDGTIALGSKVTLESERGVVEYTLVSSVEADPAEKKISDESPIGQALVGKKQGDEVEIATPSGSVTFKIKKVQ